VKENNFNEVN